MSSNPEFVRDWKERFPSDTPPKIGCLEPAAKESSDHRKSLQVALDYHNMRINELQKKLQMEQFIMEYIAQEIEVLPVPRQSNSTPPPSPRGNRPTPKPRLPPSVAKKPAPPPRTNTAHPGDIMRTKSSPSPHHLHPKEFDFIGDVNNVNRRNTTMITPATSNNSDAISGEESTVTPTEASKQQQQPQLVRQSSSEPDERFSSFQGTTFGGSASPSIDSGGVSPQAARRSPPPPAAASNFTSAEGRQNVLSDRARGSRNSMQKMERISVEDENDSSDSTEEQDKSEYQQLWVTPSGQPSFDNPGADRLSLVSQASEDSADGSAASLRSGSGRKKTSRMVKVDYSKKEGGPVAIKEELAGDEDYGTDSDDQDDAPQYVRLMYRAMSNAKFMDTASINSTDSHDSGEARTSSNNVSSQDGSRPDNRTLSDGQRHSLQSMTSEDKADSLVREEENLRMRNWVVNSILQSETSYIEDLNVLVRYKKNLEYAAQSSKPMISMSEIKSIFGNISELLALHQSFKRDLEPIVAEWNEHSKVAHLFKIMAVNLPLYQIYLENYPKAIATMQKCCQEHPRFADLVKEIKCPSTPDQQHISEILHKPINRMQRNSLVLLDFIKCTPISHPDYDVLQKALKVSQHFLDNIKISSNGDDQAPLHVLVKNQLLVEYVGSKARKLRHVFLFNDLLICTKFRITKGRYQYEVKWWVSLADIVLSDKMDDTPVEWKQKVDKAEKEIKVMKGRVKELKATLRREMKEIKDKKIETTANYKVQRLTRKIQEQEGNLLLAEPRLSLTIKTKQGSHFVFLLPSDYERREWQESLKALQAKVPTTSQKLSLLEVQTVVDSVKDNVQLNNVGEMVLKEASDEDIISGQLTITIHKIMGLQEACDTFTAIEVDSFGHFNLKAKTNKMHSTQCPVWNETFEVDLEAASTLRLICYQTTATGDVLLGKSALDLNKHWLKQGFQEKELSMNEVTLTISIKYKTSEQTIRRLPSKVDSGLFGVKLSSTCRKEGLKVPAFVTACMVDVESRGLDETGIYRVSGTTSDVQYIRKAFDKNAKAGKTSLQEVEINAVTGALKLYFRELPEALFTDNLYPNLVEAYKIQDKDEKEKKMISLVGSLPDHNYHTCIAVLDHLVIIGDHSEKNKMPFHNLAVVFGPTLLKPADKTAPSDPMDLFSSGANDAMYQSGILYYLLTLRKKGIEFR